MPQPTVTCPFAEPIRTDFAALGGSYVIAPLRGDCEDLSLETVVFLVFWVILFVLFFLLPYGFGSRVWGPPRPTMWPGRNGPPGSSPGDRYREGWGVLADVLWLVLLALLVWLLLDVIG